MRFEMPNMFLQKSQSPKRRSFTSNSLWNVCHFMSRISIPWWPLHMPTATRHEGDMVLDGINMLSRVIWSKLSPPGFKRMLYLHIWWFHDELSDLSFLSSFICTQDTFSSSVKVDLTWWEPLSSLSLVDIVTVTVEKWTPSDWKMLGERLLFRSPKTIQLPTRSVISRSIG